MDTEKPTPTMIENVSEQGDQASTQPASNIHKHPKLWPKTLKMVVLANICLMVFNGNFHAASIAVTFSLLRSEFQVEYTLIASLVSYSVLMIGLGCLLWIPTSVIFGKRLVLLLANMIFLGGCIWSIYASSLESLLGSRILASFGAGAVQAVGPSVIGEIFFERSYSTAIAVYSLSLCAGAQLGPLLGGHIAFNLGWRWIFKLCCILVGINTLTAILLLPETAFKLDGGTGATAAVLDARLAEAKHGKKGSMWNALKRNSMVWKHPHVQGGGFRQWLVSFVLQLEFMLDPIVLCTGGLWGIVLSWTVVISVTTAQLFSPPPFFFTSAELGNWTGTSFIGIFIAMPIAGPVTDALSRRLTKIKGRHEPEHRLYSMTISFLVCSPGLLIFGFTYLKGSYHGPAVGYAMQAAGLILVPATVLSYAIDSYPYDSAEIVAFVNALTHLISFGISKTAPQWLARDGVKKLFIEMAVIQWAIFFGLTMLLIVFGKKIREKTAWFHSKYGYKRAMK